MRHYKSYKLLVFFLFMALLQGCIDDPVNYKGSMIEGKVYDKFGMYYPFGKVSVGDYPIVATDIYGKFSLENNQFPYNITISDIYYYTEKYIGITNPIPVLFSLDGQGYSIFCNVTVKFPKITSVFYQAIIKFISADKYTQPVYKVSSYDERFGMQIFIPNDKSSIRGKLIFLQYSIYENSDIYSFDKFGIKEVELIAGYSNPQITFTENDVSYDPPELYSEFNIQLPPEYNKTNSTVSLIFPGMDNNSAIELPSDNFDKLYGYITLPELPMLNYNVKFTNYASIDNYFLPSQKWEYAAPGEDIIILHNKSLSLQQPLNGKTDVNDNTNFSFLDNTPEGVYVYRISTRTFDDFHIISVVTDKNSIPFKDFKSWGYQFKPNTTYYWGVIKYPGHKNIDEFVSSKLKEDTVYKKIPASELFTFKTR